MAVFPRLLIDTALIDSTWKRMVDRTRILAGGRRKRKLRRSGSGVIGIRVRIGSSLLRPVLGLKTKRGQYQRSTCGCYKEKLFHILLQFIESTLVTPDSVDG